jgi:thiamine-phosphate pyrophosphorylase
VFWISFWPLGGLVRALVLIVSRLNNSACVPLVCYVTDQRSLAGIGAAETRAALLKKIEAAAAAGVDWVQIREKDLSGKGCAALTREALQRAAKYSKNNVIPTRLLVNDRLDVALSEGASGVHLGENSLPVQEAKRLVSGRGGGKDFLLGVSCHSLEAAKSAARNGADYLFFGPVFATPSKAAFGAPQGLERLAKVCSAVSIPVLSIGGVTLENASSCLSAGASGIAAIRLFQDAEDLAPLVRSLRKMAG